MATPVVFRWRRFLGLGAVGLMGIASSSLAPGPDNLASGRPAQAAPAKPLLVGAASSLGKPLQALAPGFNASQKVAAPRFNFAASGVLQQQIQQGAPIDVFVSAGEKQMDRLEKAGLLVAGSRRVIATNQLVLVVPLRSPLRSLRFQGLDSSAIHRIAIGDRSVPAGDYGRQTLAYYGLSGAVQDKLVPLGSAQAVAQAVAAGDVDAGIVYKSDAHNVPNLRIVAGAPEASHRPIRYSAAVVAASRQPNVADAYLASLGTAQASQVLRRYGLLPLPAGKTP
jgi:molybdate transport system substrate-binding protein